MKSTIATILLCILILLTGCTTVDRQGVYRTMSNADSIAASYQAALPPDDPLADKIADARAQAAPVIAAVQSWASGTGVDPTADVVNLLNTVQPMILSAINDDDRRRTVLEIFTGVRVALAVAGLNVTPQPEPGGAP